MSLKENWHKFRVFLSEDSWASLGVTLVIAFLFIKFLFFPVLSFVTGSSLPLVIVESCSMHHYEDGFEKIFETSDTYLHNGISINDTAGWDFQNGFNKGDVIFIVGDDTLEKGDVIVFQTNERYPLIHRVIRAGENYGTKGDNYKTNPEQRQDETKILEDQIVGKALFRVPFIGWAKLIFFEGARPESQRGFCK